jgi:ribosomal subunit interface protein
MSFRVSGKNLDLGDALRERVLARVAEAMGKYFDGGYSGHMTLARDGFGFRTECAIHLDSKITLEAEGMAADAYASADQAVVRIEKRLRRYHRRLKDMTGAAVVVFRHAAHGGINVVYRRGDGHFGWIDPQPAAGAADPH